MGYEPYYKDGWKSGEAGGTPITPEALNHMDEGITAAGDHIDNKDNPHGVTAAQVGALPISGGTLSGPVKVEGNSKIVGMGTGTNDVYIHNSASNKYLQLKDDGTLSYSNNVIYHAGNKPTCSDVGAAAASHNHAASNITSGTLAVARGGTGVTSNPSMLTNLGSTSAASVFAASPRPGVTGTLPIANGGTGATSAVNACSNLGLSPAMNLGTEYTTREKYKNKVVYAKAVSLDLGTGSGNKYVGVNSGMTDVMSFDVYIVNQNLRYLPEYTSISSCYINASGNFFINSAQLSGWTAYAIVKYIK